MSCCACERDDGKETDNTFMDSSGEQPLQFTAYGKSIQHPVKAAMRTTNADAFANDLHVRVLFISN